MSTPNKWALAAGQHLIVFFIMKDYETELEQASKEKFQTDLVSRKLDFLEIARELFVGGSNVEMRVMRESYGTSSDCRIGRASATFDSIKSIHALHLTTPKLLQVFHLDPVYWTAAITSY